MHTKFTSGTMAWSAPSTREQDISIGKNRQAADLLEVSSLQLQKHIWLSCWCQGARVALVQVGAQLLPSLAALTCLQWCLSQSILVMQLFTLSVINEPQSNLLVAPISGITQKDQDELLFLKMMLSFAQKWVQGNPILYAGFVVTWSSCSHKPLSCHNVEVGVCVCLGRCGCQRCLPAEELAQQPYQREYE